MREILAVIFAVLASTAHAGNHLFNDWGNSDSAPQCLVDISTSLAQELGIKQVIAEALVEDALELREVDAGPYVGDEEWRGGIQPDPYLDSISNRKMKHAKYDCNEKLKTDGTWRWVWYLSIQYRE